MVFITIVLPSNLWNSFVRIITSGKMNQETHTLHEIINSFQWTVILSWSLLCHLGSQTMKIENVYTTVHIKQLFYIIHALTYNCVLKLDELFWSFSLGLFLAMLLTLLKQHKSKCCKISSYRILLSSSTTLFSEGDT